MNQEGYFHNPVYTDAVFRIQKTKQISSTQDQCQEARMAKDRKHRPDTEAQLKALGHEMRRAIMEVFVGTDDGTPVSPREVSGMLQKPLANVSYHVRVLADCEAITL